ncbi:MAG: tRNA threonylcarbamoyladenosine dehydratase [Bacteroidetes bacterium GWE2_39_28]|nr:MAG: tRNA threonylcarbamoyladenosine dehydratase [Bacteroidetes bacterium GWE2_39_28]OFY12928.1 MAG: tRNA threonylcarbamoyladenosine dehydratase [Bacteroidetes bacterium GWF2_39_10]OFZ08665.1 MAG: tRNA threonylcarbamoyladenosine dehydratase [Bacteroidetes bacterium RIFOXYB2_FULL_39_7]OFZ10469.1 MAG: tRNA threonylcarbamoyladenosine dehydratase [Bacteroidetes bacterium RIFOXYC2_FULL_39_11]HCT93655.1 tRNA threonylcarbamoyladenosine dehydratase [Rikenellaceae bacterium]
MDSKTEFETAAWLERSELLLGKESLERLNNTTIAVIGLGGVGAFAAEMVARAGTGKMVILDSDVVNESNKNRQLLALDSTMGKSKISIMRERLLDINPNLEVVSVDRYLTEENVNELLGDQKIDFLIDAIDTLSPKIALIKFAVNAKIPLVSSMGAGAKTDATRIKIKDISKSFNCPLAYVLRKKLRKEGISKGFMVVFSEELPNSEAIIPVEEQNKKSRVGTISYLPAVFGCIAAQAAISSILGLEHS